MNLVVGIDASRNRSGGAIAHLVGILSEGNPLEHGIREVHVWGYKTLLDALPDVPWLIKHNPPDLERSLLRQVLWQFRELASAAKKVGCNVLLTTDAATVCRFRPMVVMSQDLLSYEPGMMRHFGFSKVRFRLIALLVLQTQAMRFADGVIFLTQYTSQVIQKATGKLARIAIIPHGVGVEFKRKRFVLAWPDKGDREIRCLYVSHASMYKHQWVVVRAISLLRERGYKIRLILAGGGVGRAQQLLEKEIAFSDPQSNFVKTLGVVPHDDLPSLMAKSHIFVFASSCENLPVTLLEAMATGLPISCSNRGPMPEVLADGGVYFDPEDAKSIAGAVERIITDEGLRRTIARRAKALSDQYSWARCADETWAFLANTCGTEPC